MKSQSGDAAIILAIVMSTTMAGLAYTLHLTSQAAAKRSVEMLEADEAFYISEMALFHSVLANGNYKAAIASSQESPPLPDGVTPESTKAPAPDEVSSLMARTQASKKIPPGQDVQFNRIECAEDRCGKPRGYFPNAYQAGTALTLTDMKDVIENTSTFTSSVFPTANSTEQSSRDQSERRFCGTASRHGARAPSSVCMTQIAK
jgi:hypothetical protein